MADKGQAASATGPALVAGIVVAGAPVMPALRRLMFRAVASAVGALLVACAPTYEEVHIVTAEPVPAPVVTDVIAYKTLDDGTSVEVVTYVHSYVEPVTAHPSVVWSGRVYYNVGGSFVHFSPLGAVRK
jgi:hypothetical protein